MAKIGKKSGKKKTSREAIAKAEIETRDMYLSEFESSGIEQIRGNQNANRSAPVLPPQATNMHVAWNGAISKIRRVAAKIITSERRQLQVSSGSPLNRAVGLANTFMINDINVAERAPTMGTRVDATRPQGLSIAMRQIMPAMHEQEPNSVSRPIW